MGSKWRISQVEEIKTHKRYLLKNLVNPSNTEELCAITKIQGQLFREFSDDYVSLPRIVESGCCDNSERNYVIEEEKFGLKAGKEIINSLPKKDRAQFIRHMSLFIYKMHVNEKAAKFMDFRKKYAMPTHPDENRHYAHLIHQNYSVGCQIPMIHGDLTPRNILLSGDNKVSIIDWGESRVSFAFVEFDIMYTDKYGFGPSLVDEIAEEYCFLRETDRNLKEYIDNKTVEKKSCDQMKHCAKPNCVHRLPVDMRPRSSCR